MAPPLERALDGRGEHAPCPAAQRVKGSQGWILLHIWRVTLSSSSLLLFSVLFRYTKCKTDRQEKKEEAARTGFRKATC